MNFQIRQFLIHLAGCILFLMLPLLFAPDAPDSFNIFRSQPTQRNLIAYVLMIAFFYFNYFLLIPKFYFERHYSRFLLATFICFIIVVTLPSTLFPERRPSGPPPNERMRSKMPPPANQPSDMQAIPPKNYSPPPPPPQRDEGQSPSQRGFTLFTLFNIAQHLFIFLAVAFFSLVLKISNRWKQTEKEKINAELLYLRGQINPHFLFNTLNNIYSLALEKSDNTATAVVKLSGMMRYVLNETHQDFVSIEKEISYISSYIELQQMRFGNSISLAYRVNGDTTGKKIAPLILIAFIENAFKHGINAEEDSCIRISIDILSSELNLLVRNNKVHIEKPVEEHSGLGIENTKNRLNLLYPSRHTLMIQENEKNFTVSLNLQLT